MAAADQTITEVSFEDFKALVRQTGVPEEHVQLERLYEGYLKLRRMVRSLHRPADLETGPATDFQPMSIP